MKIPCQSCHKSHEGALIQCEFQGCTKSQHVRCAAKSGWIYNWEKMTDDLNITRDDQEKPVFCQAHRERGIFTYKMRGMDGLKRKEKKVKGTNVTAKPAK